MTAITSTYIFYEIAALLVLSAFAGLIGLRLRQPLIVAFIAVGILAGPAGWDLIRSDEAIKLLAELGIAILLFLVGLKLDLGLLRSLGVPALIAGGGQVLLTTAGVAGSAYLIGYTPIESMLLGIALAFSSTIVIIKLLSDKKEIDALHGRLALGILIVQDIVVVMVMIGLSAASPKAGVSATDTAVQVVVGALAMIFLVLAFARFMGERLAAHLSRVPELLLFFVVGWAALLAAIGYYLGIGKELGGLLAGISFASTSLRDAIASRLASLRDFLLLFFFIALGASFEVGAIGTIIWPAVLLCMLALIFKPVLILGLTKALKFPLRTSMLTSITLGQISEFSLIMMTMAVAQGLVSDDLLSLVTLVALVTIMISGSLITYMHPIQRWLEGFMPKAWEDPVEDISVDSTREGANDAVRELGGKGQKVLIFGMGRYGVTIAEALREGGCSIRAFDFNPEAVDIARARGFEVRFGDGMDDEFVEHLSLGGVDWVISTIPDHVFDASHEDARLKLIKALRGHGYKGGIALVTQREESAPVYLEAGATKVFLPYRDAAIQAASMVLEEA